MRITKQQLTQIIEEEVASTLLRKENRRLLEAPGDFTGALYDVEASELLDFAATYSRLGANVTMQLNDLLDMGVNADLDPRTVSLIRQKLGGRNLEIDEALEVWESAHMG